MVLFAKRPQEDEEPSDGQDIVVGSHVVVLSGRHFPAFGAGDLGLVSRVDKEAQNCEVLFEGRSSAVPVALRHLRVHRWPTSPKAGRHGADRAGLGFGGGNSAAASAPEDGAWQPCSPRLPAARRGRASTWTAPRASRPASRPSARSPRARPPRGPAARPRGRPTPRWAPSARAAGRWTSSPRALRRAADLALPWIGSRAAAASRAAAVWRGTGRAKRGWRPPRS
ncbi:unnamed protein product, partial [Prorocentrum cordatum]